MRRRIYGRKVFTNYSGYDPEEAPHAYKDIDLVMQSQIALVDVVGSFFPKIVKMDEG